MAHSSRGALALAQSNGVAGNIPELKEADYQNDVLQSNGRSHEAYVNGLILRAADLHIFIPSGDSIPNESNTSGAESSASLDANHAHADSPGSHGSASPALTSPPSKNGHNYTSKIILRRLSRRLTFAQYDVYLSNVKSDPIEPRFPSSLLVESATSLFRIATRNGYKKFRRSISLARIKRETAQSSQDLTTSCTACREDLEPDGLLRKLPCGHRYCPDCLRIMINQAAAEESKMPPRCCTQPIPTTIIKSTLTREDQTKFLKAVIQFSTPWATRVFCSNRSCGEFIPPRAKINPKRPFEVVCRECRTRVCITCQRDAHPAGQDCPADRELDTVLRIGERSGWRRCYKCRTLVELSHGCTHITCRCRAQFCYICGAIWDPFVGCPNFCNGDEEMERRRQAEEARIAALAAEEALKQEAAAKEAAEQLEAEERARNCGEFIALRIRQVEEMNRFRAFEQRSKWHLWTRHAQQKITLVGKNSAAIEKMIERHAKTSANLEDRQVAAEMELRSTLEQSERSVRVRLKHMEAYCDGLGQNPISGMPSRTVTEKDLRELGQQYTLEKNMKQLHQAKINVMRDRQAKALEQLLERQEAEMHRLTEKNRREVESLESTFADEEDVLAIVFDARRSTLETRWKLEMEIMRKELETLHGLKYALLAPLEWPKDKEALGEDLIASRSY
ncbi:hypothetical protein GGR50DRAFT_514547 [Xylaria sp. CBS 124048]|nr:hypothetical protein GGR50DRAFT_514547 [Xylaria sp. CBS 124048]